MGGGQRGSAAEISTDPRPPAWTICGGYDLRVQSDRRPRRVARAKIAIDPYCRGREREISEA